MQYIRLTVEVDISPQTLSKLFLIDATCSKFSFESEGQIMKCQKAKQLNILHEQF